MATSSSASLDHYGQPDSPSDPEPAREVARGRGLGRLTRDLEGIWKGSFCFVQAADTQFGMIDSFRNKDHAQHPDWSEEIRLTQAAVEAVNQIRPRPRFFVVCGDLVDAMPGVSFKGAQIRDFKAVFSRLHPDIRLVCVCGNHDVGDVPTADSIQSYREDFGDEYFSFWVGGVKFIVINSQLYHDYSQVQEYRKEQDVWLDKVLTEDGTPNGSPSSQPQWKHLVGLQHIPPFVEHPDEDPVDVPGNPILYFNYGDHTERKEFLDKIKDAGMRKLFCGHYHRNAGGWDGELEVIVTSAVGCQLGDDKHGLRIVRVFEDSIQHTYYPLENVPTTLNL